MVLLPPALLAALMASRRLTVAPGAVTWATVTVAGVKLVSSSVLVTVMVAGARRASRASRLGRQRAGALRMVRGVRANSERIQVRAVMGISSRGGVVCGSMGGTTTQARRPGARAVSGRWGGCLAALPHRPPRLIG